MLKFNKQHSTTTYFKGNVKERERARVTAQTIIFLRYPQCICRSRGNFASRAIRVRSLPQTLSWKPKRDAPAWVLVSYQSKSTANKCRNPDQTPECLIKNWQFWPGVKKAGVCSGSFPRNATKHTIFVRLSQCFKIKVQVTRSVCKI